MQTVWQDLKFAARMLRKNPGFTAVAVLTLALGIGANTAIFSVINTVLLKPLPYADASRLIQVSQTVIQSQTPGLALSFTKYEQIRQQSQTLESMAAYYTLTSSLVTNQEPESVQAGKVSEDFFRVLGASPALGRTFLPEEELPGGRDVAIISDGFWHSHFGGDPGLLGRVITLDGKNVTVVGILPESFRFPMQFPEPQIWMPRIDEIGTLQPVQIHSGATYLIMLGKLREGIDLTRARAELKTIDARYRAEFGSNADATKFELAAVSLQDSLVGTLRPSLLVLLGAVGFVLLIACANVANLLLARATAREREIAIRKALGASGTRLVRQLLSESLLLSFIGGVVGVALSAALMPALRSFSPGTLPRLGETHVDLKVLFFSLGLCLVTGILFGIVPSLQATRKQPQSSLKEGGRGSSEGGSRGRLRGVLVVAEVAVALVLMTGAGLLIQSFGRLMHLNPGFTSNSVMTFPLVLPSNRYGQPQQQAEFYRLLLENVKAIPQVQSAGVTSHLPLSGAVRFVFFCPEGTACQGVGKDPVISMKAVTPGYFDTIRTPLIRGRVFSESDVAGGNPVVIINQTTADRFWPNQDPIGKRLANSRDMVEHEIIGVVADVKFNTLDTANSEEMYYAMAQSPWSFGTLTVRSEANSELLVAAVRRKIAELDAYMAVSGILTMDDVVATSVAQPRIIMEFVGVFAGFGLLLSGIGIYGVMAYSVNQRKQEMGIRVALGAKPIDILKLIVGQGMGLTLVGVCVGLVVSLLLTRLLASLLFGIHAIDPVALGGAAATLGVAAFLACYLPARRATQVDPNVVLRAE